MAFDRWSSQIIAADNGEAQRALLGEIGVWRAQHLTDIPALREAAFAVSRLQGLLGNHDESVREARSLLSLCQTTPVATGGEVHHAKAYLASLGEQVPNVQMPRSQSVRSNRKDIGRERGGDAQIERALRLAVAGDHAGALRVLKGKRGRGDVARVWIRLSRALLAEGEEQHSQLLALDRSLRQALSVPAEVVETPKKAREPKKPEGPLEGALEELLQRKIPRRRDGLVRLCEQWLADHADQGDTLASTILRDHLTRNGAPVAAPWTAVFVAQAFDGEQTQAAIAELKEAGSVAVEMFDEPAFARAVALRNADPKRFSGLRRGLLRRSDAMDDRRLWTLRIDNGARMLVLAPAVESPWTAESAAAVVERLPHLCEHVVVFAPGAGNASLRDALAAAGFATLDGEPSDTEIYAALDRAPEIKRPPRTRPAPKSGGDTPAKEKKATKTKPPEDDGVAVLAQLAALLAAPEIATAEVMAPVLGQVRKLRDAFLNTAKTWDPLPDDASARLAPLLEAADAAAPDGLRIPEAVTLALRVAAKAKGPTLDALTGPVAERFAGPGISDVVDLVAAAADAGWDLRRAFRGTTRRERRNNEALTAMSDALDGVWRLEVEKADKRVELWFLAELPVEGRAALPQLLLDKKERVIVLPIDADLSAWYASIGGPEALGWTGDESAAVGEALGRI